MPVSHAHPYREGTSTHPDDVEGGVPVLVGLLSGLTDPRQPRGRRHQIGCVLAVAVVAVLAGACNFRQIGSHATDLPTVLLRRLGARFDPHKLRLVAPTESTLRRVLQTVDAHALDLLVGAWLAEWATRETDGTLVIALDGKVLRGAWDTGGQVTLFSAMLHRTKTTIAQIRIPNKTTEVTQVGRLLDGIDAPHVLITVDAAHTVTNTAELITRVKGWDYIMTVKANTPTLQHHIADLLAPRVYHHPPAHTTTERGHGRITTWSIWVTPATGVDFPHATQLACLRRDVADLAGQPLSKELALIITSATTQRCPPHRLAEHVRGHWAIESGHWIRDTLWDEDDHQSVTGNGPHVMATLRNLTIGLIRRAGITKIKETTEAINRDRTRALPLIS